ncbi:MAG TPA: hypothetical protein VGO93_25305 [Candidatus Xenobia bacterium]
MAEVLVSGFVLTIILVAVLNFLPSSLLAIGHARRVLTATSLARSVVENQRAAGFSQFDQPPQTPLTDLTDDGTTFHPLLQTLDVSAQADPTRVKGIRVTVLWDEHGSTQSVYQELWICNVPPN